MKKIIYMLIIITVTTFGQVRLDTKNIPAQGDRVYIISFDEEAADTLEGGTDKVWDFRNMGVSDNFVTMSFVDPSLTPFAEEFAEANLAAYSEELMELGGYIYYNKGTDKFDIIGIRNAMYPELYDNPSTQLQAPFSFGSTYSDEYSTMGELGGVTIIKNGSRILTGDANGVLHLPGKEGNDVLRVKTIDEIKTHYYWGEVEVGFESTVITNYSWYDNQNKFPLLSISYTKSWNDVDTIESKTVQVYTPDMPTGIHDPVLTPAALNLEQNYPNPFNPTTEIKFAVNKSGMVSLDVYDILGNKVAELVNGLRAEGNHTVQFNAEGLSSGTYFYILRSGDLQVSKKMVLLK